MTDPPNDPWQNTPRMSPEQGAPPGAPPPPGGQPPPPGSWATQPPQYGAPPGYGPPGYGGYQQAPRNGLGIASLVCGLVALPLVFVIVGGLVGAVAVVLGIVGLSRVKRRAATNRVAPIIGIVTGGLAVLGTIGLLVAVISSDEFSSLTECIAEADTPAEENACQVEFQREFSQ